jgi:hypothetical protein
MTKGVQRHNLDIALRSTVAGFVGTLWSVQGLLQPLPALDQDGRLGPVMDAITDAHGGDVRMIDDTSVPIHHPAATLKKPPLLLSWTKPRGLLKKSML